MLPPRSVDFYFGIIRGHIVAGAIKGGSATPSMYVDGSIQTWAGSGDRGRAHRDAPGLYVGRGFR